MLFTYKAGTSGGSIGRGEGEGSNNRGRSEAAERVTAGVGAEEAINDVLARAAVGG